MVAGEIPAWIEYTPGAVAGHINALEPTPVVNALPVFHSVLLQLILVMVVPTVVGLLYAQNDGA